MVFKKLYFGSAGIPLSTQEKNVVNGIKRVRELGLDANELEFVRMVFLTEKTAVAVKEAAKKEDVLLTCHGQYFINLNSQEKAKVEASKKRIYKAAKMAYLAGASSMTFHAAYYMQQDPEKVYLKVKKHLKEIIKELKNKNINIWIRPETTGKQSQFGDLKEIIKLSQELDQVMPCVDFAHLFARSIGKFNEVKDFKDALHQIEKGLGRSALDNMHIHMSGINYGQKGELHHLNLKESKLNYNGVLKSLKDYKAKGIVISESKNIEKDGILMQKAFAMV